MNWAAVEQWESEELGGLLGPSPEAIWIRSRVGACSSRLPTLAQPVSSRQEDVRRGRWEQDLHGHSQAVPAVQSAGEPRSAPW